MLLNILYIPDIRFSPFVLSMSQYALASFICLTSNLGIKGIIGGIFENIPFDKGD